MTVIYKFPNGFQLIWQKPKNNLNITSIQCICNLGSIHETDQTRGSSHFIEHMCFKGTKKLPFSKNIFQKYDEIGAVFNAFTCKRYTCYYIKCMDDYITNCIIILSDILLNSLFEKKEHDKELQVVIQENIKSEDKNENVIDDIIDDMIYSGSSYQYPVDHIKYHSRKLNHSTILNIYQSFYRPENMILSVVSNIPFKQIIQIIKKTYFLQNKKTHFPKLEKNVVFSLNQQTEIPRCIVHRKKGVVSNNIAISFRTCSQYNKDKYALEILKRIIGGLGNSMLFDILREQNGLTYSSFVQTNYYENTGNFTIIAITDPTKIMFNGNKKGVLKLIIELLNDLIINGVELKKLNIAKQNLKGRFALDLEDNDVSSLHNAEYVLLYSGISNVKYVPYDKLYNTYYKNVNSTKINEVIRKYFTQSNMNVCLLTDEHNKITDSMIKYECAKFRDSP
jgi:predicted Zn-dependent peptidase